MFRKLLWWLGGFSVVVGSFLGTLYLMDYYAPLCPQGMAELPLGKPFPKQRDFMFFGQVPDLAAVSDTAEAPTRSSVMVCENDRLLGPAHSAHGAIAAQGGGRFSHSGIGFYFSSTDNTDPNTNGRNYRAVYRTK